MNHLWLFGSYFFDHLTLRGMRFSFSIFFWHLLVQKWKTVPSVFMYIFPVPGSILSPQNEHTQVLTISSPQILPARELSRLTGGFAKQQYVPLPYGTHYVPGDYTALVVARKHTYLYLASFPGHSRSTDNLHNFRRIPFYYHYDSLAYCRISIS